MSEERFREAFRRITSGTPDAPDFADLEVYRATPRDRVSVKPWMALTGAAAIVLVVVGALGFWADRSPDLAIPEPSSTTASTSLVLDVPADCPVTIPDGEFTPPSGYPPVRTDGLIWYGTDGLWTVLSPSGSHPGKSEWWSTKDPGLDPTPELSVAYTLLNESRQFTFVNDEATNGSTSEDGLFMIAAVDTEYIYAGCWEVTAVYGGASLSYVYFYENGLPPDGLLVEDVPDVLGLTVSEAREVLAAAGYSSSASLGVKDTFEVCSQDPGDGPIPADALRHVKLGAVEPGGCNRIPDNLNTGYLTYLDEFGRAWYATSCPSADVLISGGVDAADGLPVKGQTERERVDALVTDFGQDFADRNNAFAAKAVVRNGEVWDRDEGGGVIVEQVADYMVELILADDAPCPSAPLFWNGVPVAFVREAGSGGLCPDETPLAAAQVMVFFDCGNGDEPNPVGFARPLHPDAPDRVTSVFWHLLAGPSSNERGRGAGGFFGGAGFISADLNGDHLIVDFNSGLLINNASTSTGSLYLLSELTSNAFSVDEVKSVEFRINGSCEGFWAFLQAGDDVCNVIDRP